MGRRLRRGKRDEPAPVSRDQDRLLSGHGSEFVGGIQNEQASELGVLQDRGIVTQAGLEVTPLIIFGIGMSVFGVIWALFGERLLQGIKPAARSPGGESREAWTLRATGLLPKQQSTRICRMDQEFACLRSEEHTSELQSRLHLVCRLLLEK